MLEYSEDRNTFQQYSKYLSRFMMSLLLSRRTVRLCKPASVENPDLEASFENASEVTIMGGHAEHSDARTSPGFVGRSKTTQIYLACPDHCSPKQEHLIYSMQRACNG